MFEIFVSLQNGSNLECPDLDFVYNDTDTHPNEIAELYSYTEQNEFHLNVKVRVSHQPNPTNSTDFLLFVVIIVVVRMIPNKSGIRRANGLL